MPCYRSLRDHNPNLDVVLLYNDLNEQQLKVTQDCEQIRVRVSEFSVKHRPDLTLATFFKFYLQYITHYDAALWLDSDTIILADIAPLFSTEFPLGARFQRKPWTKEYLEPEIVFANGDLHPDQKVLQGGVVYFDVSYWLGERILDQAVALGRKYGWDFFRNADQGMLNIMAHRCQYYAEFPVWYNYCRYHDMIRYGAEVRQCSDGVVRAVSEDRGIAILHWNGRPKPYEVLAGGHVGRGGELNAMPCFEQYHGCSYGDACQRGEFP